MVVWNHSKSFASLQTRMKNTNAGEATDALLGMNRAIQDPVSGPGSWTGAGRGSLMEAGHDADNCDAKSFEGRSHV